MAVTSLLVSAPPLGSASFSSRLRSYLVFGIFSSQLLEFYIFGCIFATIILVQGLDNLGSLGTAVRNPPMRITTTGIPRDP